MAKRHKTAYPGVFWISDARGRKRYYIRYRRGGRGSREYEEPVSLENVTPRIASEIRARRIAGDGRANGGGERRSPTGWTLADIWMCYRETLPRRAADESRWRNHLGPALGGRSPHDLSTADVYALRRRLEAAGLAPQTVWHVLTLLTRILGHGVKAGMIRPPDPARLRVEKPRVNNVRTETMTDVQLGAYMAALDAMQDRLAAAYLRVALLTGVRKNALLRLRWADVDFSAGRILLRAAAAKNRRDCHIPLVPAVAEILRRLPRTSVYVFPGRDGALPRSDFRRAARQARDAAGLPKDFRPMHGLRHTFASRLASSGRVSLYEIQRLLTQQSPEMAQRYAHLADAALQRAADAAVRALTPCTAKDMESDEAGESIAKRGECLFAEPGDEG